MIVSIHQPQYLPWLGYFAKVACSDVFVFLDTVQFKKNEYQNRNRIRTPDGWQWLTVPVRYRFPELIREVRINNDQPWTRKHLQSLTANYARAPYCEFVMPFFEGLYQEDWEYIGPLNRRTVTDLLGLLGITTPVRDADEWTLSDDPTRRLVDICRQLGADTYLSGAGGRGYLDEARFQEHGIRVEYQAYDHPTYPQHFGGFEPYMSVIDLLFNCGPDSAGFFSRGTSP